MDLYKKQLDWEQRKINFYNELDQMTIDLGDPNINYRSYVIELAGGTFRLTYEDKIIHEVFAKNFIEGWIIG